MKGNLTRRGEKSWRLKFDAGRDPVTGKRLTKYVTLRGTRAQAQAQATKIMAEALGGRFVDPSQETVADFVERWLTDWAQQNVAGKTFERYSQLLHIHLVGCVGGTPIQKLRAADLQRVYAAMSRLADRTRLQTHRVIHRMLRHAHQWGVVSQNVAAMLDAPTVRSSEIEILSPEQVRTVLETLKGRTLYAIVATALGTGCRRGELVGLQWKDVDLDREVLMVERSVEQTKGRITIKAPKTRLGRRMITLAPTTVEVLREHRKVAQEQRLALGLGRLEPDAHVFATVFGAIRSPRSITNEWAEMAKRLGIKATFHSLRHTHVSLLISSGLDVLTISRRLGHASAAITLGVYGHLFKPDDRAALAIEHALTS
jgi:integrase